MLSSIYLTGSSIDPGELSQAHKSDWRTLAITRLMNHGLKVTNPLEIPWTETEFNFDEAIDLAGSSDQRVRRALGLIDQSDAVLANLERPSYGTAMEIFYAYRSGKHVTVFGSSPLNPWVATHSQARFNDIDLALRHIIGNQPRSAPVDWAIHYENQLSERYEQMPPYGEPDYKFFGGDLPILVIAPHATAYFREGEFQEQESFTGSMAVLLNRRTACHALTSNYCLVADPCVYADTPFKTAIKDLVKAGNIGLIMMILGSSGQQTPGLQIEHCGPTRDYDFEQRLRLKLGALEEIAPAKIGNSKEELDRETGPLSRFISEELAVPLVTVKLSKRYRMPRLQSMLFSRATDLLAQFILESSSYLNSRLY
ncbi:MAG: nucleoside 2-deoxyribosyltransferase domain-containing protein [Candidatus Obscuribacterales bacterium]|nr:nucleoside 2-deoxyribosyltransferase domain-containing protein [Candidatus Obscuribacterales bacterium]